MRQAARTFQDLIVWQKAHEFVLGGYKITEHRTQNSEERSYSDFWVLSPEFFLGEMSILSSQIEEVSRLLTSYTNSILSSEF